MIAVDTNLLVRLLTADEPRQTERAQHLFATEAVFLSKTVLLEVEWVLRRLFGHARPALLNALLQVVDLRNTHCEDESQVRQALAWAAEGMDFADAMHLAASARAERFVTFDKALIKVARRAGSTLPVLEP